MKKRVMTAMLAGAMSASMVIPAFATGGAVPIADGTDVVAGIIIDDENMDARIKVEVPTLFAFVVNGTTDTTDLTRVSADDETILLPNVKVKVLNHSSANSDYAIETEGSGEMKFTNYSTRLQDDGTGTQTQERVGMAVELTGSIKNEGTAVSRNYWEHVADAEALEADDNGFKKYTLEVDSKKFNDAQADTSLAMEAPLSIAAPDVSAGNIDDATQLAKVGEVLEADFNVYVGGQRGQYSQVEESAKVGSIVWTVTAEAIPGDVDVPTSPSNPPLSN